MRRDPDLAGDERTLLTQFVEYQRATVLAKCEGLDADAMSRRLPPSALTLAGLLLHLALVEETWFEKRFAGLPERQPWAEVDFGADPGWEFRTALSMEHDELRARYTLACQRSDAVLAAAGDIAALAAVPLPGGEHVSLRWYSST